MIEKLINMPGVFCSWLDNVCGPFFPLKYFVSSFVYSLFSNLRPIMPSVFTEDAADRSVLLLCKGFKRQVRLKFHVPRNGQTVVEYTLMLALIISVVGMVLVAFHKKFLGGLFSIVGIIIGAGNPE